MAVKKSITSNPRLTVSRYGDGTVHVKIDGYEVVRTCDRKTVRVADIYLYEDGYESGMVASYDEDGRCIRYAPLDHDKVQKAVRELDLWQYASVA
jgi:hypothetical protein